uniref:Uncharacterized protein n=1 Tax=Glossina pallidipes TaxID=7398 RepID=A0A1A9ZTN5_GLOPL
MQTLKSTDEEIEARYANFVVYINSHTDLHLQFKNSGVLILLFWVILWRYSDPLHHLQNITRRFHGRRDNQAAQPLASRLNYFVECDKLGWTSTFFNKISTAIFAMYCNENKSSLPVNFQNNKWELFSITFEILDEQVICTFAVDMRYLITEY